MSCIFQMQDPNAFFSQIKYFQLLQLSEMRVWSLRYPQIWLADSCLSVGNLKKVRQLPRLEVRFEDDSGNLKGKLFNNAVGFNVVPFCGSFILQITSIKFY